MSRLENTTIKIKNAKISSTLLKKICFCFSEDKTASQTAKTIGVSRQTINQYYKLFRNKLLEVQYHVEQQKLLELLEANALEIKHLHLYNSDVFYIEVEHQIIILDENLTSNELFEAFFFTQLKPHLINHKRAKGARVLFNPNSQHFFVSGYLHTHNEFDDFILNRLKQFRGINPNNIHTHLKESQFRFNHQDNLYEHLLLCFI